MDNVAIDTVWVVVAGCLVLLMQAGFAALEMGLSRMKHSGAVAAKIIVNFALALVVFATWRPSRLALGALLFGGVSALGWYLQAVGVHYLLASMGGGSRDTLRRFAREIAPEFNTRAAAPAGDNALAGGATLAKAPS